MTHDIDRIRELKNIRPFADLEILLAAVDERDKRITELEAGREVEQTMLRNAATRIAELEARVFAVRGAADAIAAQARQADEATKYLGEIGDGVALIGAENNRAAYRHADHLVRHALGDGS